MPTFKEAKQALDKIIRKSRVHLYKPIQIAEILFRHRTHRDIDPALLETYRNPSKTWRDQVCMRLLGRVSTSSQKFQDNLFEANALPPPFITALAAENARTKGAVEKHIYDSFAARQKMVSGLIKHLDAATPSSFQVERFVDMFVTSAGLRRSVDKALEIVVYALFSTIVSHLSATVTVSVDPSKIEILRDFEDFTRILLGVDAGSPKMTLPARLYRVGVTNAADRGLDMWANFGPAIQVKHLTFSEEMAEDITNQITADQVVIVCRETETKEVKTILDQLGLSDRVRGVITEKDLARWYEKCLRGRYARSMGLQLLDSLRREFRFEFPAASEEFGNFYKERGYAKIQTL
jgi:HaeII restriction endonuclease